MLAQANSLHIPLADGSVHMCVTSPPYWGLRDYGVSDQLGLEPTPEAYVADIVAVMREVWRVMRDDGTCWLNLGDSYAGSWGNYGAREGNQRSRIAERWHRPGYEDPRQGWDGLPPTAVVPGLKPKDLVGIPWRVAFALQADGWYLRSDIIWAKPNPMPESVTDRPTKSHEYLFLLSKSARYYYDAEAVKEESSGLTGGGWSKAYAEQQPTHGAMRLERPPDNGTRNRRSVWTIPTTPYKGAHFATFPPALVAPCVLAGTSQRGVCPVCGAPWERVVERERPPDECYVGTRKPDDIVAVWKSGGMGQKLQNWYNEHPSQTTGWRPTCSHDADPVPATVLDPFCGSGTVGQVCRETGRRFVGLDLSARYLQDFALPRAEGKQTRASVQAMPLFGGAL